MKQRSVLLLFVFVFWTMFFLVARGVFLACFSQHASALTATEILAIFRYGVKMDLSAAAYASAVSGILLALMYFKTGIQLWPVWIMLHAIALIVASGVIVCDLALYPAWGYRIDIRALTDPGLHLSGTTASHFAILMGAFLLLVSVALFISFRFFSPRFHQLRATSLATLPVMFGFTALLIIPMRGGLGVVEMNVSAAYSHRYSSFANHAGVNVVWNMANSMLWSEQEVSGDTQRIRDTNAVAIRRDSTSGIINRENPNIIIILLDRFPAELIGALGGRSDVTPRFNALTKEGLLFDQIYSNSDRTDKGLAAVLNGYPSPSHMSALADARRTQGLPYLNKVFKSQGYTTGFTYGGWPNYQNLRAYLFSAGFDSITHANNFVEDRRTGKWGVPDEFVFEKFADEVFHDRAPFFRVMMTQGTRPPYDMHGDKTFTGTDEETQLLNAAHYTDKWLGNFIEKAKSTLWWENTLVIITADQGNAVSADESSITPAQFRIPMLWLGGALARQDSVVHTLGNQTDISNTLLSLLGHSAQQFAFSRNLLSPSHEPLAMFVFDRGFGIVKPYGAGIFKNAGQVIYAERVNEREAEQGRAYLNAIYSDYAAR